MPRPRRRAAQPKDVIAITHPDDARRNIPTTELEPVMADADRLPVRVAYERRNRDSTRNWFGAARTSRTTAT